jgi:uncharacterized protein YbjT (DUF2867 family)
LEAERVSDGLVLVAGATGYVGGRLVPALLRAGYRVRAAARGVERLRTRPWASHPSVELAEADVLDPESLRRAVHSMTPATRDFVNADRAGAQNMADAAAAAGLQRLVYLGGLGDTDVLRAGPVPVTVLRAAMIIGSGSASFEILRYLVDRLPGIITPRWLATVSQPVAVSNVLTYLVACLEHPETAGETYGLCAAAELVGACGQPPGRGPPTSSDLRVPATGPGKAFSNLGPPGGAGRIGTHGVNRINGVIPRSPVAARGTR